MNKHSRFVPGPDQYTMQQSVGQQVAFLIMRASDGDDRSHWETSRDAIFPQVESARFTSPRVGIGTEGRQQHTGLTLIEKSHLLHTFVTSSQGMHVPSCRDIVMVTIWCIAIWANSPLRLSLPSAGPRICRGELISMPQGICNGSVTSAVCYCCIVSVIAVAVLTSSLGRQTQSCVLRHPLPES